MGYLEWLAHQDVDLLRVNRGWMTWNTALAVIPALMASALFPRRDARTVGWWAGVVAFFLFLPNAPYVVTDLVHLRWNIGRAPSRSVVLFGVLPLFAAFITVGYLAYLVAMDRIVAEVENVRRGVPRWMVELTVHAVCVVGIILGRVARLNSWDTITDPRGTIERTFVALSWSGAPAAGVLTFIAVVVTYSAVRAAVMAAGRVVDRLQSAVGGASRAARSGSPGS